MMDDKFRLGALDGWRGISIILVLAAHLLPLGPKWLMLNEAVGAMGMALFFTLSGFLITRLLTRDLRIRSFLVKRFFRIVPLAWIAITFVLITGANKTFDFFSDYLFFANLTGQILPEGLGHFWSLNVEMQFYAAIALLFLLFGRRAVFLLPIACLLVTLYRIKSSAHIDIHTLRRVDEILAGCVLSMVYSKMLGERLELFFSSCRTYIVLVVFFICSHPATEFLNYLRPYAAAVVVGSTLYGEQKVLDNLLNSKSLKYIATISFALYVVHGVLMSTWFASGEKMIKYAKRPLLLIVSFLAAHISTFYVERYFIMLGAKLSAQLMLKKKA